MSFPNGIAEVGFQVVVALSAGYVVASGSCLLGKLPPASRWSAFIALSGLLFACPFLVPPRHPLVRGAVSAGTAWWWMKSWDVFHRPAAAETRFLTHLTTLLNFGNNVTPRPDSKPQAPAVTKRWQDVMVWAAAFCAGCALIYWTFSTEWSCLPFMAEHLSKVASLLFGLVFCGLNFHSALWRFGGARALESPLDALWSASPAEFWRRWNRPVHEWLFKYVFRPIADTGRTVGAVMAAFAASGVMHEYVVAMASGRITGYPTAFFLVQGFGVLATFRLKPRGWQRVYGVALTWAFNAVTSVLLFAPLAAGTSFYVNAIPRWARLW